MISGIKKLLKAWSPTPETEHDALLRQIPLFHTLTRRERGLVNLILHERNYVTGEVIFQQGEEGLGMYLIVEGQVTAIQDALAGRRVIGTIEVGEAFGELAILEGTTRPVTLIAASSPTRLLSLFQPELLRLFESHPAIGYKICYAMAGDLSKRFRSVLERDPEISLIH